VYTIQYSHTEANRTDVFFSLDDGGDFVKTRRQDEMNPLPEWAEDVQRRQAAVSDLCVAIREALEMGSRMLATADPGHYQDVVAAVEESRTFWATQVEWARREVASLDVVLAMHLGRTCRAPDCHVRVVVVGADDVREWELSGGCCSDRCEARAMGLEDVYASEGEDELPPTDDQLIEEAMEDLRF